MCDRGEVQPESVYIDPPSPQGDYDLHVSIPDLIVGTSREEIVYFQVNGDSAVTEGVYNRLQNLRTLHLVMVAQPAVRRFSWVGCR